MKIGFAAYNYRAALVSASLWSILSVAPHQCPDHFRHGKLPGSAVAVVV